MGWNYRVCKKTHICDSTETTVVTYEIHEAYYNSNGDVWAITERPIPATTDLSPWNCQTEEECVSVLNDTLNMQAQALEKPIIDLDTFIFADADEVEEDEDIDSCESVV